MYIVGGGWHSNRRARLCVSTLSTRASGVERVSLSFLHRVRRVAGRFLPPHFKQVCVCVRTYTHTHEWTNERGLWNFYRERDTRGLRAFAKILAINYAGAGRGWGGRWPTLYPPRRTLLYTTYIYIYTYYCRRRRRRWRQALALKL